MSRRPRKILQKCGLSPWDKEVPDQKIQIGSNEDGEALITSLVLHGISCGTLTRGAVGSNLCEKSGVQNIGVILQ